jgi:hypothetical protein
VRGSYVEKTMRQNWTVIVSVIVIVVAVAYLVLKRRKRT